MIADAIATNDSLLELDIEGNRLDINTSHMIAQALGTNENLRTLKVLMMIMMIMATALMMISLPDGS